MSADPQSEAEELKQEIERLNQQISNCQAMLPATGAPVSRQQPAGCRSVVPVAAGAVTVGSLLA